MVTNYTLNKFTTLEFGYSVMFANTTNMLAAMSNTTNYKAPAPTTPLSYNSTPHWGYLMMIIKPDFLFTKPVAIKQP
jgi:hypothetical protein